MEEDKGVWGGVSRRPVCVYRNLSKGAKTRIVDHADDKQSPSPARKVSIFFWGVRVSEPEQLRESAGGKTQHRCAVSAENDRFNYRSAGASLNKETMPGAVNAPPFERGQYFTHSQVAGTRPGQAFSPKQRTFLIHCLRTP